MNKMSWFRFKRIAHPKKKYSKSISLFIFTHEYKTVNFFSATSQHNVCICFYLSFDQFSS